MEKQKYLNEQQAFSLIYAIAKKRIYEGHEDQREYELSQQSDIQNELDGEENGKSDFEIAAPHTNKLLEIIDSGTVDPKEIAKNLAQWIGSDECEKFMHAYELDQDNEEEYQQPEQTDW